MVYLILLNSLYICFIYLFLFIFGGYETDCTFPLNIHGRYSAKVFHDTFWIAEYGFNSYDLRLIHHMEDF